MDFPALHRLLDRLLHAERFAATGDLNGVFLPPARPQVSRLGLALEPGSGWLEWIERERIDAVFLHRPWRMDPDVSRALETAGVGVLAYHLAFDEHLTTGFNPALADACAWGEPTLFAEKEGRPPRNDLCAAGRAGFLPGNHRAAGKGVRWIGRSHPACRRSGCASRAGGVRWRDE